MPSHTLPSHIPLVSVVVWTFNRPAMLGRALRSLCDQTMTDFEVVVVNDGGLDPMEVIDSYAARLDVRLVHQPENRGRAATANLGLAHARGRLVNFLADDDTFMPHHLADVTRAAAKMPGPAMIYGPAFYIVEDNTGTPLSTGVVHRAPYDAARLWWQNFIVGHTCLFDRGASLSIGGMDESFEVLEDWEFWLRLAQVCTVGYVDEPTVSYHIRAQSSNVTNQALPKFYEQLARLYDKHPVAPGSVLADLRAAELAQSERSQSQQFAFEHSLVVMAEDDPDALFGCLESIMQVMGTGAYQVIVHAPRTPRMEQAVRALEGDVVVCLAEHPDEPRIRLRAIQQAAGRHVTFLRSADRLRAVPAPTPIVAVRQAG